MRVGFTGIREDLPFDQGQELWRLIQSIGQAGPTDEPHELHHGVCVGADKQAHEYAKAEGWRIVGHPPIIETWMAASIWNELDEIREAKQYLIRNADIVDETDILIACPRNQLQEWRSGTWATIRYARTLKRPIVKIYGNGTIQVENYSGMDLGLYEVRAGVFSTQKRKSGED